MTEKQDIFSSETLEKDYRSLKKIAAELIRENGELKNRLHDSQRELHLLYTFIRKISYTMEWNEIQEMILDIILDFFPVARFCLIALYPESGSRMIVRMKNNTDDAVELRFVNLDVEFDETTSWDEIVATNEWNDFGNEIPNIRELQSSFIPLNAQEKEIGFLMVAKEKGIEYTEGEWHFLSTIAHQFAVTLENSHLYHLAITDALTGLFNVRYFHHRLEREIEKTLQRNNPLSLLMLDIDHFKRVNDTHGHPTGDIVLKEMAARIRAASGERAAACRYGGEEFTIILLDTDKDRARETAESIRERIAGEPFVIALNPDPLSLDITVSIGVSACPIDAGEPKGLVNSADQAMYLAKAEGRNRVV